MALSTKELKETRPTAEDYRRAAAIIARDPLYLDRENARLFAADPANRSAEFQQYQHKIANGTATERDEILADAYGALARANEAERLAPELADALARQKLLEGFDSAKGTMTEKANEAQTKATQEAESIAPNGHPKKVTRKAVRRKTK